MAHRKIANQASKAASSNALTSPTAGTEQAVDTIEADINSIERRTGEMDPQHIIDVCEANWDANKTDCNHFVKAVADALGITIFGPNDNADAIINKLSSAAGWSVIPDRATVESRASAGDFIIAGLRSSEFHPPRNNGHVVVVVAGDDSSHPGFPMAYWGTLNGVGKKNSSIRNSFIPGADLDSVHYFGTSLVTEELAPRFPFRDITAATAAVESLMSQVVKTMGSASDAEIKQGSRVFFPNGVELIDLEVKVGTVDIKLKVAGPKAETKP
jgi:hypothetical protein